MLVKSCISLTHSNLPTLHIRMSPFTISGMLVGICRFSPISLKHVLVSLDFVVSHQAIRNTELDFHQNARVQVNKAVGITSDCELRFEHMGIG